MSPDMRSSSDTGSKSSIDKRASSSSREASTAASSSNKSVLLSSDGSMGLPFTESSRCSANFVEGFGDKAAGRELSSDTLDGTWSRNSVGNVLNLPSEGTGVGLLSAGRCLGEFW